MNRKLISLPVLLLLSLLFLSCHSKSSGGLRSGWPGNDEVLKKPVTLTSIDDSRVIETISGKVIGIIDGDTFDLLNDSTRKIRIRMEGIDAPERGMPFYQVSKKFLSSLCFGKSVIVQVTQKEAGGRLIGFTYLDDGRELSHEMVRAGLAWHFVRYNSDQDLADLEREAREAGRGLWFDKDPHPPWEIRTIRRSGQSTKDLFEITDDRK